MITNQHQDNPLLRGPTQLARLVMRQFLRSGDHAVDATCGNGHDTLLLADLVGPAGKVWAFDIQEEAIRSTALKLEKAGMPERVELIMAGHESMSDHVSVPVRVVMFNLGYRPGGDRNIITRPETTLSALEQSLQLILPAGILAITVYPGHCGGDDEERAISQWSTTLDQRSFHAWHMGQVNATAGAPYFFLIQKAV
jgi:hypothetical protein